MHASHLQNASPACDADDVVLSIAFFLSDSSVCPVDVCNLAAACKAFHGLLADTLQTKRHELACLRRLMTFAIGENTYPLFADPFATSRRSEEQAAQLKQVECLSFAANAWDAESMRLLPRMLSTLCPMTNLRELDMSANNIRDTGLDYLSDAFGQGSFCSLRLLNLGSNGIGNEGMTAFCRVIAGGFMGALEELDLPCNRIGDAGMQAFASAVGNGSMQALAALGLNSNLIGDAGMVEFSRAIDMNSLPACTGIDFSDNPGDTAPLQTACEAREVDCFV